MNRQTLIAIASGRSTAAKIAHGILSGSNSRLDLPYLNDALLDEGISPMFETLKVGDNVLIETVTKYWYGTVKVLNTLEVKLEPACWIPDTGRFNEFVKTGEAAECEPCGSVSVLTGMIVDFLVMTHRVPTKVK